MYNFASGNVNECTEPADLHKSLQNNHPDACLRGLNSNTNGHQNRYPFPTVCAIKVDTVYTYKIAISRT